MLADHIKSGRVYNETDIKKERFTPDYHHPDDGADITRMRKIHDEELFKKKSVYNVANHKYEQYLKKHARANTNSDYSEGLARRSG